MNPLEEAPENLTIHEDGSAKKIAPAVMMDDADESEAIETRSAEVEQVYSVKPFFWHGIQLAPLAISREGDWMMQRELLDAPPLNEIIHRSSAMAPDALRVLWFLAHDPSEWLNMPSTKLVKSTDNPEDEGRWVRLSAKERAMELEAKIRAWGEVNVAIYEGAEMVSLFYDIYTSAHSTRATAKPSDRKSEERSKN